MTNQELKKALCGNILDSKNGNATKTNLDMIKAIYIKNVGNHTLSKESTPSTINMFFVLE